MAPGQSGTSKNVQLHVWVTRTTKEQHNTEERKSQNTEICDILCPTYSQTKGVYFDWDFAHLGHFKLLLLAANGVDRCL